MDNRTDVQPWDYVQFLCNNNILTLRGSVEINIILRLRWLLKWIYGTPKNVHEVHWLSPRTCGKLTQCRAAKYLAQMNAEWGEVFLMQSRRLRWVHGGVSPRGSHCFALLARSAYRVVPLGNTELVSAPHGLFDPEFGIDPCLPLPLPPI